MKIKLLTIQFILFAQIGISQIDTTKFLYNQTFEQLRKMLSNDSEAIFKKAVFVTENAYLGGILSYEDFEKVIEQKVAIAELWLLNNKLNNYPYKDSLNIAKNGALFKLMTDTIFLYNSRPLSLPLYYDFEDFFGQRDWTNMFVTKLLSSNSGNCHSMPYLYKILADEIGAKAYLSMAPNHIYIKLKSEEHGWYNTELTSASFPVDAWIMASGYVNRDAIVSGIYMDTLSEKQSIALCLVDLAHGYMKKEPKNNSDFVLKCCNLAIEYYPNYVNALILKAEALRLKYESVVDYKTKQITLQELESTLKLIVSLGYKEIPKQVYFEWLAELSENQSKYQNKNIIRTFNTENIER